jgi:SAM-dependent methyltransferase
MANETQAELWTETVGPLWVKGEERVNAMACEHGFAAIAAASVEPGERILDVGCGLGHTSFDLARRTGPSGSVVGLDISSLFVRIAQERADAASLENVSFVCDDAQTAELDDVDVVFSEFGVMFFEDAPAAFANLRRALRDGGRLAFSCWQGPMVNPWMMVPTMAASAVLGPPQFPAPGAPGPFSLADTDHVLSILRSAGFADVELASNEVTVHIKKDIADFAQNLGFSPLRLAYAEADAETRARAEAAVTEAMERFAVDDHLEVPSASWIVTARV